MEEKKLTGSYIQKEDGTVKKQSDIKHIQILVTLVLPFLWIGYFYSCYRGNESNMNSYTSIILICSFMNSDLLWSKARMENNVLNWIAKIEGILLIVLAVIMIINVLI